MEAYVLFARGKEATILGRDEEQEEEEEDIGCPSSGSSSDEVELADDASSSGSTTAHFEMASLMTQLPIKRGLSQFFDGKSQSFASLAAVAGLEDLPKPPAPKRLKTSRSCGGGLRDARLSAAGRKASRARLASSRKLMVRTPPSGAVVGQPLLFA